MQKKYIQEMWLIHDVLFLHKKTAEELEDGKETIKQVFVGIDEGCTYNTNGESAEFFGSWIFTDLEMSLSEVNEFNSDYKNIE